MRNLDLADLELVDGGANIHTLGLASHLAPGAPTTNPLSPTLPGITQPGVTFAPSTPAYPTYPAGGFAPMPPYGGGFDAGPCHGGGEWGGHHHGGMHAFQEFRHDPTFQAALQQFAAQHPDAAGLLAPLASGQHGGFWQVMHDPNGRAAFDAFLRDPTLGQAYQQFSAQHPDMAGPLANTIGRMEMRLEGQGMQPQPGGVLAGPTGSGYGWSTTTYTAYTF